MVKQIHTMEYYSAIQRDELLMHIITWINFQRIMLSGKKKEKQNVTYCMIPLTQHSWKKQNHKNEKQMTGSQRLRREKEVDVGYKNDNISKESLWWWKRSVSWLCQWQYPGCDRVLQFCKMLPLGETG